MPNSPAVTQLTPEQGPRLGEVSINTPLLEESTPRVYYRSSYLLPARPEPEELSAEDSTPLGALGVGGLSTPSSHSSLVMDEYVGVEIEMEDYEFATVEGSQITHPHWQWVSDGSLRNGMEARFARPLMGEDVVRALSSIAAAVASHNSNARTSTHVHINMGNSRDTHKLLQDMCYLYYIVEDVFFHVAGEHRRWSGFSTPWADLNGIIGALVNVGSRRTRNLVQALGSAANGRYTALNLQSLTGHGTLEFRHFPSSVDESELLHYINMCLSIKKFCLDNTNRDILTLLSTMSPEVIVTSVFGEWGPEGYSNYDSIASKTRAMLLSRRLGSRGGNGVQVVRLTEGSEDEATATPPARINNPILALLSREGGVLHVTAEQGRRSLFTSEESIAYHYNGISVDAVWTRAVVESITHSYFRGIIGRYRNNNYTAEQRQGFNLAKANIFQTVFSYISMASIKEELLDFFRDHESLVTRRTGRNVVITGFDDRLEVILRAYILDKLRSVSGNSIADRIRTQVNQTANFTNEVTI